MATKRNRDRLVLCPHGDWQIGDGTTKAAAGQRVDGRIHEATTTPRQRHAGALIHAEAVATDECDASPQSE